MKRKECGFEQREVAATKGYWDDPRWEQVNQLHEEGKHPEANGLVFEIRDSYGVD
jgi:hypothetical protein